MPELDVRPSAWIAEAPITATRTRVLPVGPDEVFARLADTEGWADWFPGMRKATGDDPLGLGARRSVWVGPSRIDEEIVGWEPGRQFAFALVRAPFLGVRALVEDWTMKPADGGSQVTYRIGLELRGPRVLGGPIGGLLGGAERMGLRALEKSFSG